MIPDHAHAPVQVTSSCDHCRAEAFQHDTFCPGAPQTDIERDQDEGSTSSGESPDHIAGTDVVDGFTHSFALASTQSVSHFMFAATFNHGTMYAADDMTEGCEHEDKQETYGMAESKGWCG